MLLGSQGNPNAPQLNKSENSDHEPLDYLPPPVYSKDGLGEPKTEHVFSPSLGSNTDVAITLKSFAQNEAGTPFFWVGSTIAGTVSVKLPSKGSSILSLGSEQPKSITFEASSHLSLHVFWQ